MPEVRLALRRLRRHPGRSLATALALAVGIGATVAAFTAVDAVLLRGLPVERQDELVVVWRSSLERGSLEIPFRAGEYDAVARGAASLSAVAGVSAWGAQPALVERSGAGDVFNRVEIVGDFFGVLGSRPAIGRLASSADDAVDAAPVAVLSHDAWRNRYGADPSAVGSTLEVEGVTATIVGVAPEGFDFPRSTDLWTPARIDLARAGTDGTIVELHVVGRTAPGVDASTVADDVTSTLAATLGDGPSFATSTPVVRSLEERVVGPVRPVLRAALLAAVLLLLAAAANGTLFLLAEGSTSHEFAVRRALGAERVRLVGRLVADASLMGALGLAGGLVLAWMALRALVPLAPPELPRLDALGLDARAVGLAVLLAVACTLLTGAMAGWAVSRLDPGECLASGPRTQPAGGSRLRRTVASVQVGLTVVSALGAGLLMRTVAAVNRIEPGIAAPEITVISLRIPYTWFDVPESYLAALDQVVGELESRPGIVAVRPSLGPPLAQRIEVVLARVDQTEEEREENPFVAVDAVMPGHFEALGIPLLAGRGLTEADDRAEADPVVVVDEVLARTLWPEESALGKGLVGYLGFDDTPFTVVGVVAGTRYREILEAHPRAYYPLRKVGNSPPEALLVRASELGPGAVGNLVREAFARADPRVRVMREQPMVEVLRGPTLGRRFAAGVLVSFALATLLLGALGVYAVFTVSVGERTREMGVRRALGAQRASIVGLVLVGILKVAVAGAAVGLATALWAARLVGSLLYGVAPTDPPTVVAVVTGSLLVAMGAGLAPALRASATDPVVSLRSE